MRVQSQQLLICTRWVAMVLAIVRLCVSVDQLSAADAPVFLRGLNLSGPPVVIDSHQWDGQDAKNYVCNDKAFENQAVLLMPPTDPERAKMIRSSRWGGNRVELTGLPSGTCTVFLYVWEDNNPEFFSVAVNGRDVLKRFNSGSAGQWQKLGPWFVEVVKGSIVVTSQGGAANFSGIEVWRGKYNREPADTLPEADIAFFDQRIRPLLVKHCHKCHSSEAKDVKGELLVDSRTAIRKGGQTGPAIVAGDPEHSLLIKAVRYKDENLKMPPDGKLSDAEIADLEQWVKRGAPDPRLQATKLVSQQIDFDEARTFWSFQPLSKPPVPQVHKVSWPTNEIDHYILAELEKHKLSPADMADKRTLIRRATFGLTGLPTTPTDIAAFLADTSPTAFETVVARLLDSPQYGERWARHWLDVARYADSDGQEGDADRPNAHHFRDFVIRSLNNDLPYNTFVRWQLAGDEIAPDNPQAIAATGFIVAGSSTQLSVPMEEEKLRNRANELDDMVSTTSQALLGLTLACSRCHDHKYDPLPTRDYYRMMRVFNGGDRTDVPLASPSKVKANREATTAWQSQFDAAANHRDDWLKVARKPFVEQVRAAKIANLSISNDEKQLLRERPDDPEAKTLANRFKKELKVEDAEYVTVLPADQKGRWDELDKAVKAIAARKPAALPAAFAFADFAPAPRETWFFERGDFMARNELMDLGFLSVLTKNKTAADYWSAARESKLRDDSTQQRRAMADWITDLDHGAGALLARVMVNRVWQHHFGEGLVRTVSDFGSRGEPPTHPELLEWLTSEFVRSGWSLKHLHRLIVNSATYLQGTALNEAYATIDPDNRLLWRRRPQRLESEALRDSMLAVAGSLNPTMFGPSFKPPIAGEAMQARNVKDSYPRDGRDTPDTRRRSVYMFHKRVVQYPLMQAFDAPDAQVSCGRRVNTTVAPQALALLNDPFVRLRAGELAKRLQTESGNATVAQIRRAFQIGLNRDPASGELDEARTFVAEQSNARQQRNAKLADDAAQHLALTDFCQMLFALNEFVYVD